MASDATPSHSQAVDIIKGLYSRKRSGFGAEEGIRDDNLTYGELTFDGMASMVKNVGLTPDDVFVDLGSGTGKLLVYVAIR